MTPPEQALLAKLDAGIERHQPHIEGWCRNPNCDDDWPCETLKALRAARVLAVAMTLQPSDEQWHREALAQAAKEME